MDMDIRGFMPTKKGAARSASLLTDQAVCRMNCSAETLN